LFVPALVPRAIENDPWLELAVLLPIAIESLF
jgi:hypothetical protein